MLGTNSPPIALRFDPSRRRFMVAASAATASAATGCGYFPPQSGPAFAPWDFPDDSLDPRISLVHAATLAASPHNTQPWWFTIGEDTIELSRDADKSLGAMDPLGREQVIGVGCALENLLIAAPRFGFSPTVTYGPRPDSPDVLARVELTEAEGDVSALFEQIPHRRTNRYDYADSPLPSDVPGQMQEQLAEFERVRLHLFQSAADKHAFREGTNAATRSIVNDVGMWDASHRWWRQTEEQIEHHRDGLTMDMLGVGSATRAFGKLPNEVSSERAGRYWIRNTEGTQLSGSAFGFLSTADLLDTTSLLQVGRAWQRLHLWVTAQGAACHPLNQMAERRDREHEQGLEPDFERRLTVLADGHAQMLFRVGYAWDDAFASPRRPVDWVSEGA